MRTILAPGAKVRGYIKEVGDRKELIAPGGRLIAFYDEEKDQTILAGGRLYGYGDQLADLLPD
jgi:hypothetical protein